MIIFRGKFNADMLKQFNKHAMKKVMLPFIILAAVFLSVSVRKFVDDNAVLGVSGLIVAVAWILLGVAIANPNKKKASKNMPLISDETDVEYQFDYETFKIVQRKGCDYCAEVTAKYCTLLRIEESATCFFLYSGKNSAHVVCKGDLVEGSLDDLRDIFARNFGSKFVSKNRWSHLK